MKKTITKLAIALSFAITVTAQAQSTVTFDTFTLSPNSYYQNNASTDFTSNGVTFQYGWNTLFGGYWESGSAYTNLLDTVNGTYTNLYGCIPGTASSGNNYATIQNGAVITLSNTTTAVSGFYITNTTYAWKEIKKGGYGRRFGDTTGTFTGDTTLQGHYRDWFKVLVRGFRGGTMITDSVQFFLADYRSNGTTNDYVIKNWQFVNCSSLGQLDSLTFVMKSSDNNSGGMKTPGFFSMDNFTTQSTVGIEELSADLHISLFPNPASQNIILNYESKTSKEILMTIYDITGKELQNSKLFVSSGNNQHVVSVENLEAGIYIIELKDQQSSKKIKFIKL